jgi:uncharacterized protein YjiS (DUF1127 family)
MVINPAKHFTASFDCGASVCRKGRLGRFLRRVREFLQTYWRNRQSFAELWELSDRELADIGLTRAELPHLVSGPVHPSSREAGLVKFPLCRMRNMVHL